MNHPNRFFRWRFGATISAPFFATLGASFLVFLVPAGAQDSTSPLVPLGNASFQNWQGVENKDGVAKFKLPGAAIFQYPAGPKGWYVTGFRTENDSTSDWRGFYGIQFDVTVPAGRTWDLEVTAATPPPALRPDYLAEIHANYPIPGRSEWQRITLPWASFDLVENQRAMLKFIQQLRLSGKFSDGAPGEVQFKNVRLIKAPALSLEAVVQGKSVLPGETARYAVTVGNCTDIAREVTLRFKPEGWSTMAESVEPDHLMLAPGATADCTVLVKVPATGVPPGGHETQVLQAWSADTPAPLASLDFITARDVARPSIIHTPEGWAEVRANVAKYDWAKKGQADDVKIADDWQVPEASVPPNNYSAAEKHTFVFEVKNFVLLPKVAYAWQLTHNKAYAEKIALFLRRLADEKTGYPSTFASMNQEGPQEGEAFQSVGIAYDAILDAGVLSDADKSAINHMLRLAMATFEPALTVGNVGNWSTAADTACLFCALAMGDLHAANRYLYGPCGFTDYVTKGIMDDGWWWECSSGYNFWVASELTQDALACQPWGIDLLHEEFPANFSAHTIIMPSALHAPYGISFEKWGPTSRATRSIKQLWDAVPLAADYRGITFGLNDGHEELVAGTRMELAYYAFRDPRYLRRLPWHCVDSPFPALFVGPAFAILPRFVANHAMPWRPHCEKCLSAGLCHEV